MAFVNFQNVTLSYPIYNSRGFSVRNQLIRIGTGGLIESESGHVDHIKALRDITFSIKEGDCVGLIGHNGSGKTTLLRTIGGIYEPNSGIIEIEGNIATLFDQTACMEIELSGYDNIRRILLLLGSTKEQAENKIKEIEEFTELGNFLDLPVRTYSTGMAMRLNFAISTSLEPEILLVDEIFEAGDKSFKEKAKKRINNLISSSKIFIFASHSMEMIKEYCNRIFILDHGILVEENLNYLKDA